MANGSGTGVDAGRRKSHGVERGAGKRSKIGTDTDEDAGREKSHGVSGDAGTTSTKVAKGAGVEVGAGKIKVKVETSTSVEGVAGMSTV